MYDAGQELGGDPPVIEFGVVELVPGEAERKERANNSDGFGRAASNGDTVLVCDDLKMEWGLSYLSANSRLTRCDPR